MRTLLALPALVAMLCAAPAANATLATYASDFNNGNLSTSLPNYDNDISLFFGSKVSSFSVVPSGGNSLPAGDSVAFTSSPGIFFRGTSSPASIPGFVSFVESGAASFSIQFNTTDPVSEIRLSVADLETAGALEFSTSTSMISANASGCR